RIWATGITQVSTVDKKTGKLHLVAKGFAGYPKGLPWLEDVNWIANDAFRPVHAIWDYLQDPDKCPGGDLHVIVYPQNSGVEMLPGFEFTPGQGQYPFAMNFFATFVRAVDKVDCGDYIDALARDVPFDFKEEQYWN